MNIAALNDEIEKVCSERAVGRRLQICVDSLCAGVYEIAPGGKLQFTIAYDGRQIKLHIESREAAFPQEAIGALDISMLLGSKVAGDMLVAVLNADL